MSNNHDSSSSSSWKYFIIEQAAWLLLSTYAGWAAFIVRLMTLDLFFFFRVSRWSISAFDKFATIPIFTIWLIFSAWLQFALNKKGSSRAILRESGILFLAITLILGVSMIIRLILA